MKNDNFCLCHKLKDKNCVRLYEVKNVYPNKYPYTTTQIEVFEDGYHLTTDMHLDLDDTIFNLIKIKFCPFCGRELK